MDYVTRGPRPMYGDDVVVIDQKPPRQVVYQEVQRVTPPPRYHSPVERYTKVEPQRGPYYRDERVINTRYQPREYTHNYGSARSLSNRRCCTAAITVLCLLGLAGLAIGLYFGITAAQKTATANLPQNNVQNGYKGYYVNGVYVVPVTTKPSDTYLIIGNDMPCNPYNNNSAVTPSPYYPNCNAITTSIVKSNWTTTTTQAPTLISTAGSRLEGPWMMMAWSVVFALSTGLFRSMAA